jgi:protein-disulfide isomerase
VWGVVGYAFFLFLMLFALHRKAEKERMWTILMIIAGGYSLYSIILAAISTFYIHSYCIMCIVTYAVNFLLLYYAWLIKKRFDNTKLIKSFKRDLRFLYEIKFLSLPVASMILLCLLALPFSFPAYWNLTMPAFSLDMPKGTTEDGHPWIGAEKPKLVITEFTDYRCFQCKKMHYYLRGLISSYPDKIRLVHRHFPMDHEYNEIVKEPFHVGSGKLSLVAIYAGEKGKFWEMNDLLFNLDRSKYEIDIKEIAEKTGLDHREMYAYINTKYIQDKLKLDIWTGMKKRILGTPAYIIDGEVYVAQIPPEIIKKVLE